MIKGKTSNWESELWRLMSAGDGVSCPLHNECEQRKNGGWCLDNYKQKLNNVYSLPVLLADPNSILDFKNNLAKTYPANWKPGPIFQMVESLANRCLEKSSSDCAPISTKIIKQIYTVKPVEVRIIPLKSHHGAVWHLSDNWVIHLNKCDSPGRQRISLFHEVFHILAHCSSTPIFRRRGMNAGSFNEVLADYFALCILMPEKLVRAKWSEVQDVKQMEELFQVSEISMWFRLRSLGLVL
jgi:Zn-dependent peptidase ImmA (M78 family)